MTKWAQLLFYQRDANCFFIVQGRCDLGLRARFGIIVAHSRAGYPAGVTAEVRGVIGPALAANKTGLASAMT